MIPLPSCFLDKPLFAQLAANSSCTHGSVVHARFQRRNGPIRALCADSGVLITGETGRGLQPEILALGHHIGVLHRSVKRPKFNSADRFLWAGLYGVWNNWWSTCCSSKLRLSSAGIERAFARFGLGKFAVASGGDLYLEFNSTKQPGMLAPLSQLAARSMVSGPGFEASGKVVSAVDKREMRKGLRKVSKLAALFGIVLFG
jgi:hypothetical protein